MKIVLQRVSRASVAIDGQTVASIEQGLLLLIGFGEGDSSETIKPLAKKVTELRVFPNQEGRFDRSVKDIAGRILAVPQFTLYGNTEKGRRPDFFSALKPELASPLFNEFCELLEAALGGAVPRGIFGADMKVELVNDGPVTLLLKN